MASILEPGQFDDAPEDTVPLQDTRPDHAYIDTIDANDLDIDEEGEDIDEEDDSDYYDESYETRVEDEDWENAERDFTKQYNRLRQHAAVRTGNAEGTTSSISKQTAVVSLPAVNTPKATKTKDAHETKPSQTKDRTVDQLTAYAKYSSRLAKIDSPWVMGVGVNRKGPSAHANMKDKSDRATNEQVLDPRTRLILFKMIGRELISEINGCVSTGKEANVYHAVTPDSKHLAVKIYKTSILVFKDRDKYVTGEHRFRRGYSRNPRKMVKLWAEKEMRNLKRLVAAGINAPEPLEVRENVLVMALVGDENGWASPRLKDATIPAEGMPPLYSQLILNVRTMYHTCHLVHADLSEYNILYHNQQLWIIDVSQSVEHDHPAAFDFLRSDLKNVEEFFGRHGVKCLGLRKAFDFVTREKLTTGEETGKSDADLLAEWIEEARDEADTEVEEKSDGGAGAGADSLGLERHKEEARLHEEAVFMHSFIPRNLNDIFDPERDVEKLRRGEGSELLYADSIGIVPPVATAPSSSVSTSTTTKTSVTGPTRTSDGSAKGSVRFEEVVEDDDDDSASAPAQQPAEVTSEEGGEESEDGEDGSDGEVGDESKDGFVERKPRGHRHEDKEAKKERKKQVKADNQERRKQKMPKAEKKKLIKKTTNKSK